MEKITKSDIIGDVIEKHPESGKIFIEAGMACIGCPMMKTETIEQGARNHGLNEEEINELVIRVNEKIGGKHE